MKLGALSKRLEMTQDQLQLVWGDVLEHVEPMLAGYNLTPADVRAYAVVYWLTAFARQTPERARAVARRMLPALKTKVQDMFLSVEDFRYASWTWSTIKTDQEAYDLQQLRMVPRAPGFVTRLVLDVNSLTALLEREDGAVEVATSPTEAPAGAGLQPGVDRD